MDDTALMVIAGELDMSSVLILHETFKEIALDVKGDLIVDLGLITFMDSAGLSFLITAHKQLEAQGAQLIVFSPTPQVRRLFQITGLTRALTIEPFEQPRYRR
jgi:stage II sporulation protein AA (anti-sigma F factor antagonist)